MESLASEVSYDILLNLPYESLLEMCQVSREYNAICQDPKFWKDKLQRDYPKTTVKKNNYRQQYKTLYEQNLCEKTHNYVYCLNDAIKKKDFLRLRRYLSQEKIRKQIPLQLFFNKEALLMYLQKVSVTELTQFMDTLSDEDYIRVEEELEKDLPAQYFTTDNISPDVLLELAAHIGYYDYLIVESKKSDLEMDLLMIDILAKSYDAHYPHNDEYDERLTLIRYLLNRIQDIDEYYPETLNDLLLSSINKRYPSAIWKIYIEAGADNLAAAYRALVHNLSYADIENYDQARPRIIPDDLRYLSEKLNVKFRGFDRENEVFKSVNLIDVETLTPEAYHVYLYYLDHGTFPIYEEGEYEDLEYPTGGEY